MELIYKKSLLTDELNRCYVCGTTRNIHIHHIFYGRNRENADKDGCVVPLCIYHHTGIYGVHTKRGKELDTRLKQECQKAWLKHYKKSVSDFIERYRINYL